MGRGLLARVKNYINKHPNDADAQSRDPWETVKKFLGRKKSSRGAKARTQKAARKTKGAK